MLDEVHITRDGDRLLIAEMETSHIVNYLYVMVTKLRELYEYSRLENKPEVSYHRKRLYGNRIPEVSEEDAATGVIIAVKRMYPYMAEALFRMNYASDAYARLKSRYASQMNDSHYTLWEQWGSGTSNHGWNGAPLEMSRYGLGARATSSGWTTYDLIPQLGGLTSISGVVPTVKGNLSLNLSASNTSNYSMNVTSPGGTTANIGVPKLNSNPTISVNGTTVFQNGSPTGSASGLTYQRNDSNYVYFSGNPGTWNFTVMGS